MEFCLPRRAFVESITGSIFNIGERATIQAKSSAGSFGRTKTGSPTKINQDLLVSTNREPEARCLCTLSTKFFSNCDDFLAFRSYPWCFPSCSFMVKVLVFLCGPRVLCGEWVWCCASATLCPYT